MDNKKKYIDIEYIDLAKIKKSFYDISTKDIGTDIIILTTDEKFFRGRYDIIWRNKNLNFPEKFTYTLYINKWKNFGRVNWKKIKRIYFIPHECKILKFQKYITANGFSRFSAFDKEYKTLFKKCENYLTYDT